MSRLGRNHSPGFKAKVALSAVQGDLTLVEWVKKFDVHWGPLFFVRLAFEEKGEMEVKTVKIDQIVSFFGNI